MVNFGGWALPQQYSSIRSEHFAVRQGAGVFDLSHMGRFEVEGPGAAGLLDRLLCGDLSGCPPGRAQYTLLLNEEGGIVDDLVVYRRETDRFLLVVNAVNAERDLDWLRAWTARLNSDVTLRDATRTGALMAVQGPRAAELLPAEGVDLDAIQHFGHATAEVAGAEVLIARTGYTGEDGFEVFAGASEAPRVWDRLLRGAAGAAAQACGLGARDVCRLEAGLRLHGSDMTEATRPEEAGLGWLVRREGDFVGRRALMAAGPAAREIAGLSAEGSHPLPRHGSPVWAGGELVGEVTSGTYSFWVERAIALASLDRGRVALQAPVEIEVRGRRLPARRVRLPFWRGSARASSKGAPVPAEAGRERATGTGT